jgi:hypothetical protein
MTPMNLIDRLRVKSSAAIISGRQIRLRLKSIRIANAATMGDRAGISCIAEELSSTNPGEAIRNIAENVPTESPWSRVTNRNIEDKRSAEKKEVSKRGPKAE